MARLDSSGRANTVNTLALKNGGANQIFRQNATTIKPVPHTPRLRRAPSGAVKSSTRLLRAAEGELDGPLAPCRLRNDSETLRCTIAAEALVQHERAARARYEQLVTAAVAQGELRTETDAQTRLRCDRCV